MFAKCFHDAKFPPGVINMIAGGSSVTGEVLKRVSLELGGKNAIIVLNDADVELAAEAAVWAAFGTSGQRCTAASRLIVEESIFPKLIDKLVTKTKKLRMGDGLQRDVQIGPMISEEAMNKAKQYVQAAVDQGIPIHCGGQVAEHLSGYFFEPGTNGCRAFG